MRRTDVACVSDRCPNRRALLVNVGSGGKVEKLALVHDLGALIDTPQGKVHALCVSPLRARSPE